MPAPVCGGYSPHTVFFDPKKTPLMRGRVIVDKEKIVMARITLKRKQRIPVGTYVPTQHSTAHSTSQVRNARYQEMALNQRARANAECGNTLLASWMQESANRFTTLREQNREPNVPTNLDRRVRRNIPLMWAEYGYDVRYDVQGELLYDDEVVM